jgi:hypothetical protein
MTLSSTPRHIARSENAPTVKTGMRSVIAARRRALVHSLGLRSLMHAWWIF